MNFTELFKESLIYPSKNFTRVLVLGLLFLIPAIFLSFPVLAAIFNQYVAFIGLGVISFILFLILSFIINGYYLDVVKETISGSDDLPGFQWMKNLISGLKVFVVEFVYFIIPAAITLIVAYLTGFFDKFSSFIYQYSTAISQNATTNTPITSLIQPELISGLYSSAMIVAIVAIILFIIFTLFVTIAYTRLAETDKLVSAFKLREIFDDISKIGWGNYIVWFILLYVIMFVISFALGLLQMIPLVGVIIPIITLILVQPYLLIFSGRALGLIYKESKT